MMLRKIIFGSEFYTLQEELEVIMDGLPWALKLSPGTKMLMAAAAYSNATKELARAFNNTSLVISKLGPKLQIKLTVD
jgi:hypothetical protein